MSENLLRFETSPYLLQHRDNPVHWRAWNDAALAEATSLDRPILLSIGYAACHWCHVMAHESFEDPATAAVMNRLFVNIKVDREERPDLDQIYMAALHALGEPGGWPLTVFLMPDGRPIWGGTYFPPAPRYGRPGFVQVLERVAALYQEDRAGLDGQAERVTAHLRRPRPDSDVPVLDIALLDRAADTLLALMDPDHGGTRGAPKFPNVPLLDFLARTAERTGRADCRHIVDITLLGMANGGLFDHVGGGFARYSTDAEWLVPHFEKMLSDNGLLLERLATAAMRSAHAETYRDRIESTIAWFEREMRLEGGGFAASLDADSSEGEGRFYVWQRHELDEALVDDDAGFIARLYDITAAGNWEGVSIPNRSRPHPPLLVHDDRRRRHILRTLLTFRDRRPRPGLDDKILADWNGHAIAGLATAAFLLDRPDWLALAEAAYRFVATAMAPDGRPAHSFRAGKSVAPGFSADLAALARAALALHRASQDERYLAHAIDWLDRLEHHHADGRGGFFFTADDGEPILQRRNDRIDEATPNPHGMAADTLIRLWSLTGDDGYRARADALLEGSAADIAGNVFGTASLLSALDLRLSVVSIVVLVSDGDDGAALLATIRRSWRSAFTLDVRSEGRDLPKSHPAFGRRGLDGRATAYLCREGICSLPITDPKELSERLEGGAGL